jgi:hypothetical protein
MSTSLNNAILQGLTGGELRWKTPTDGTVGTDIGSAWVSPNLQGCDVSHHAEIIKLPNQAGQTATILITDEWIEVTFDYIQQGSTTANSIKSALLPPPGSKAEICGFPVIKIGNFADGLNTHTSGFSGDATSTQPWIYEADAGINGKAKENWDGKVTLRRYIAILKTSTYTVS